MVFQSYALYPHMTVCRNMAFGLELAMAGTQTVDQKVRARADCLAPGAKVTLDIRPEHLELAHVFGADRTALPGLERFPFELNRLERKDAFLSRSPDASFRFRRISIRRWIGNRYGVFRSS